MVLSLALPAETQIGSYRILSSLGAGGMGEVYLAKDMRLGRKVALKLLPKEFTTDRERARRFQQEAHAISALNHPNIITIYEIGEAEAGRFIAMELIGGRSLRSLIGEGPDVERLTALGRQIAEALAVAHAAGITHRDIKPENIMVRDDGYVKVLDFGLARLALTSEAGGTAATIQHTEPGTLLGTIAYMSPEQAGGERVTAATDIFALGIVFYELATGSHPFRAATLLSTLQAITSATPALPSRFNAEIPEALDSLILRMLEKDARQRPEAKEVEAALWEIERQREGGTERNTAGSHRFSFSPSLGLSVSPSHRRVTVGRDKDLAELHAGFATASAGCGSLLCVTGEPGIGKTTLVEAFLAEIAESHRCRVARGRCSERLAGTEAYLPWLEALDSLLRDESRLSQARTVRPDEEPLAQTMRRIAPTWYAQVATLAGDNASDAKVLAELRAASQERLKRELAALLEELSRTHPLVLFFDDLHWTDVSTIDLIAFLGGRLPSMSVLIVTTYRPSDLLLAKHPFLQIKPDLQARGICRELQLEFLNRAEIETYLTLAFPGHHFPPDLPKLIHAKTEGNPLFMVDLVRYLRDRGVIEQRSGEWMLAQALPEIERELPESVRGMIERKFAQLGEEDRKLLMAASVQGYEFDSAVLSQVLSLDAGEVEDRLEALERIYAFVRLLSEDEFPNRTLTLRYRFVHVLYQNELYGALRPTRKAQLSSAVAQTMLGFYGEQSGRVASQLAHLFEASRDFGRATEYYSLAAENASKVFAYQEAALLARRGLDLLDTLPDKIDNIDRSRQELRLQVTLALSLGITQGYTALEAGKSLIRAHELCEQLGEPSQFYLGLGVYYLVGAEYHAARRTEEQLLRIAESRQNTSLMVGAHAALGYSLEFLGELVDARDHFERAIAIYDPQKNLSYVSRYGFDPGLYAQSEIGRTLWLLGFPDQALATTRNALALAEKTGDPRTIANAYMLIITVNYFRREKIEALKLAEAGIAHCDKHNIANDREWINIIRGWAMTGQEQPGPGIAEIRHSLAVLRATRAKVCSSMFLGMLSEALSKVEETQESFAQLAEAFEIVERTDERFYESELHRLKGELLLGCGLRIADCGLNDLSNPQSAAETCFLKSMEIARRQSAKSLELRAVISLARLWQRQGKRAEARGVLAEVYGWFTEGFDTADLKEARVLLDELS
jgi:serine/threonine protein kinase/tetratricopeptide (TPR) repeat protein